MPSPLPHLFSWPFVYQPSRTQVWTFPHGILLITHAHHQPVVPAEHKGTRNLNMPPGASETYIENHWKSLKHWNIETLNFWMPYLEILRAWLPAGVATFWSDCRGRCSVWTRSFQAVKSCVAKWKGSTWFNNILLPHHCRSCCHWVSLKHNALECVAAANGQSEAMKS